MGSIRVVIADDSSLARGLLRAILEGEDGIEVVGEAANGRQAVELVRALRPSLVTMDLEMPVMGGLEAIEDIMCTRAVPILVVSSVADAHRALDAVARGALEVVAKPDTSPEAAAHLVSKVRLLAGVSVITRLRPRTATPGAAMRPAPAPCAPADTPAAAGTAFPRVFAIASSTGGPQALAEILPALPQGFACPVLVAQHISDGFAQGMADWLGSLCKLPVRLARDGEPLAGGTIHIAPSEHHLAVGAAQRLVLRARAPGDLYRPSCDVLLASVAAAFGARATGIILTGMGHDGAAGLAAIRAAGGSTLAQDEASSVIFGMNRVAIERGAVQRVLPLSAMAAAMLDQVRPVPGAAPGSAP
ncbi:chemotaxis-specific protein-glutamate methyltransferase CheB [Comamonas granuli]|uniref:chemotaxis-specific protein-glutamate methyltransferase CheB n=1 Tax=Comamonas granuli TaxID=290309 RepID=UPI0005A8AB2A|nr:chemotaxis-specific protein-glutamate methyltransferase CheB [Comamonas granuli]